MNHDRNLSVCADLANRLKHRTLDRRSRSGLNPSFGKVNYQAPLEAIASLTVRAFEVDISIEDPGLVNISLPVLDGTGERIGDAFDYAEKAIFVLEQLRGEIESAA